MSDERAYRVIVVELDTGLAWDDVVDANSADDAIDNAELMPVEDMIHEGVV